MHGARDDDLRPATTRSEQMDNPMELVTDLLMIFLLLCIFARLGGVITAIQEKS